MVDIDLESVIRFCEKFEREYLSPMHDMASKLKQAAASASSTLGKTEMSTVSADKLERVADAIMKATSVGEERIRVLEKKMKCEKEELDRITRGMGR